MKHEKENPAEVVAEHLSNCTPAQAAIVVDGNADNIIASLTAAGWKLSDRVEYIGGKRIRYVTVPSGVFDTQGGFDPPEGS